MGRDDDERQESIDPPQPQPCCRERTEIDQKQSSESSTLGVNELLSKIDTFQASTESRLSSLANLFESRIVSDAVKEKAFNRLYAELDELKQDREFDRLRPFFSDLVLLFDRLDQLGNDPLQSDNVSSIVVSIRDELLEILSRRGIDTIPSAALFNSTMQHALGTSRTNNEAKNNQIARIVRRGFRYNSRVIRHEEVLVYRFVPGDIHAGREDTKDPANLDAVPMAPHQQGPEHD